VNHTCLYPLSITSLCITKLSHFLNQTQSPSGPASKAAGCPDNLSVSRPTSAGCFSRAPVTPSFITCACACANVVSFSAVKKSMSKMTLRATFKRHSKSFFCTLFRIWTSSAPTVKPCYVPSSRLEILKKHMLLDQKNMASVLNTAKVFTPVYRCGEL